MGKRRRSLAGIAEEANHNFREAVRTGLQLNEMSGNWLRRLLQQVNLNNGWPQDFSRFARMTTGAMSVTQKQAGEILALMGHSTRAKAGLMEQALQAAQSPSLMGSQAKWMEFWTGAFRLAQSNAMALTQINTRALQSWCQLLAKPETRN